MADIEAKERVEDVGEEFFDDPYAHYRRWREHGPVHRVRLLGSFPMWVIIGYAEARAALADSRLRKDYAEIGRVLRAKDPQASAGPNATALMSHMLNTDPPDHTRLRMLVKRRSRRVAWRRCGPGSSRSPTS
ncbi:cytochrome P450 [Nocardia vaccinii]|uniref:cytochrome P450 n=1 Tax=Nocardia vaccinii TaxID=1822 RepID=UPI000ADB767C|nr:cytochrome P450 [Nocardia vaccinii]